KDKIRYIATTRRILPQGSPASPMITNIICRKLDRRLNGLAAKFGFIYTRYADDMSFSVNNEANANVNRFLGLISKVIRDEGFEVNREKTRFLRKNNRQSITGIVVNNNELGLPRIWIRKLRAAIYNANKLKKNGNLPIETKKEIAGMAAWIKSVNPRRFEKLINAALEVIK
ncbi:MAG TPA: reverse transcriptase family protein, partial [Candidatus Lokiarchaeia archaeon]